MKLLIFFLISGLAISPLILNYAFATHYTAYSMDDAWYWREFDNNNADSVWCTMNDVMALPFDDTQISLECKHGSYDGSNRYGALLLMKVFNKTDIQNGALTNVFTWSFDNTCTEASCPSYAMGVMDGAYDYSSILEPGGFPANSAYSIQNALSCSGPTGAEWSAATPSTFAICLGTTGTDLGNIFGGGSLITTGAAAPSLTTDFVRNTKGTVSTTGSVTQALWTESTQDYITVFLIMTPSTTATTSHFIQPRYFSITNTDYGTLTWNFPETTNEADDWTNHNGAGEYELNGTSADYGYFWSFDPNVPNPPTNLSAFVDTSDIDLDWDAPVLDGYSNVTGYKIERESPIGGGFSTLVANTGSTDTFYSDTAIVVGTEYNYRVRALNVYGESAPSNESKDGNPPTPDEDTTPVYSCPSTTSSFELFVKSVTQNSVGLCWDTYSNSTAISGYQINYTSPWGDPQTTIINNTLTPSTRTYLATNLASGTQYSFLITAWENATSQSTNIANTTTLSSAFDIGELNLDAGTNPTHIDFKFTKTIVNATRTQLDVDFTNSLNPSCNFEYRFAGTNDTYSNLTSSIVDEDTNRTSFIFDGVQNEIIRVRCYDGTDEAVYIITQESYPLIEQISAFRDGTYGTTGQFGAFDLVTLMAIILSMIGFNRVNPAVGAIMTVIVIGALATLNFITWPTIVLSAIALFVLLAIVTHSKDDISD